MKGALSDAELGAVRRAAGRAVPRQLPTASNSGGEPRSHPRRSPTSATSTSIRRHYRLDNSYLTLYGNVDIDRDARVPRRALPVPRRRRAGGRSRRARGRDAPRGPRSSRRAASNRRSRRVQCSASSAPWTPRPKTPAWALGYVIGRRARPPARHGRPTCLLDAIMGSNEAPLKRALLDAQLAGDALRLRSPKRRCSPSPSSS